MSNDGWQLTVLTGGGSELTEQLTRELHAVLMTNDVDVRYTPPRSVPAGHKGDVVQNLILLATAGTSARVLTTLIKEWCLRDRRRRVELHLSDSSLVIEGNPKDQTALIEKFLAEVGESPDGSDDPANPEAPR